MLIRAQRCWLFDDDLNTDVIHPPEFFSLDPVIVKRGLFHGLDPTLQPSLTPGDILIGGKNFGCGSSRETSIRSLKLNQVGCIVAISFARIFFRNATNNGLPCVTFADPDDKRLVVAGEPLAADLEANELRTASGRVIALTPAGEFVQKVWRAGGLLGLLS